MKILIKNTKTSTERNASYLSILAEENEDHLIEYFTKLFGFEEDKSEVSVPAEKIKSAYNTIRQCYYNEDKSKIKKKDGVYDLFYMRSLRKALNTLTALITTRVSHEECFVCKRNGV